MKRKYMQNVISVFIGFLFLFHAQAQTDTVEQNETVPIVHSIKDSLKVKKPKDSFQSLLIKVDSLNSLTDSNEGAFTKENPDSEEKIVLDTLVVETQNSEGFNDSTIQELSNLVSRGNIFYTIVFLLFGFVFIKVITFILNALAERSTKYRIAFKGSIPIVKIVGWVLVVIMIIVVIYKPSVASMLAVSASIGVAIGFASQDILKNIFGGIIILLDRPFVSGDKIEVDKYYGEVVEIGLRSTRIVTPDDSLVSVPNAVMMNSSLSNSNAGEPNCQVVAEIYLPLTINTIKTREIATQAATVSKYIYLGKPITVLFLNEINNTNSFYKMRVKAYVMDIREEFRFKSDMTELIISELVKEGILDGKI